MQPLLAALNITLTPQQEAVAKHPDRFPVIGGGERGGKSFVTAAILLPHIMLLPKVRPARFFDANGKLLFDENRDKPRNPDFLLFGPTYAEPRLEFQYLEGWLSKLGLLAGGVNKPSKPMDGPWRMVTKHGVVIATWSMEDPGSIRSVDLEGAAICEAGRALYSAVERVQGRVSAKRGFIVYSGTMEASQQWYQDWMMEGQRPNTKGIVSYSLPTFSNIHEFPGGRNDPEILRLEAMYPEDVFAMRILAEARPPRTRVLKEIEKEHIKDVRVPKDAEIEIWVDPGYATAYAVLFVAVWDEVKRTRVGNETKEEPIGKRFHIIDELYERGITTYDMIQLCQKNPYWKRIRKGVIDIAGKGHRDSTESALEVWQKYTKLHWNMTYWKEDALVERIRTSFKAGRVTIDPKAEGLIAEAGLGEIKKGFDDMHYWKYVTDRDGRVIGEKPLDKWNHAAKALGYGLLHHLGKVERLHKPTKINRLKRGPTKRARSYLGVR